MSSSGNPGSGVGLSAVARAGALRGRSAGRVLAAGFDVALFPPVVARCRAAGRRRPMIVSR